MNHRFLASALILFSACILGADGAQAQQGGRRIEVCVQQDGDFIATIDFKSDEVYPRMGTWIRSDIVLSGTKRCVDYKSDFDRGADVYITAWLGSTVNCKIRLADKSGPLAIRVWGAKNNVQMTCPAG